jgi:hypothetical protein
VIWLKKKEIKTRLLPYFGHLSFQTANYSCLENISTHRIHILQREPHNSWRNGSEKWKHEFKKGRQLENSGAPLEMKETTVHCECKITQNGVNPNEGSQKEYDSQHGNKEFHNINKMKSIAHWNYHHFS